MEWDINYQATDRDTPYTNYGRLGQLGLRHMLGAGMVPASMVRNTPGGPYICKGANTGGVSNGSMDGEDGGLDQEYECS